MSKSRRILVVTVIATGFVCGVANAEDPSHIFIDRLTGKPFRAEGAAPTTTIDSNPAQAFINRVSGAEQLVAGGPGATTLTTDTAQALVDRLSGTRPFRVENASTSSAPTQ